MTVRVNFSVKVRPSLKEEFKRIIKEKGLSTCVVVEALLSAWIQGATFKNSKGVDSSPTITVNQTFKRVVTRERRLAPSKPRPIGSNFWSAGRYYEVGAEGEVHETNRYINPPGIWVYDPDL